MSRIYSDPKKQENYEKGILGETCDVKKGSQETGATNQPKMSPIFSDPKKQARFEKAVLGKPNLKVSDWEKMSPQEQESIISGMIDEKLLNKK
ncbi:MAG: hypothetical protein AAF960_27555 [Bacteroidota bacterium]